MGDESDPGLENFDQAITEVTENRERIDTTEIENNYKGLQKSLEALLSLSRKLAPQIQDSTIRIEVQVATDVVERKLPGSVANLVHCDRQLQRADQPGCDEPCLEVPEGGKYQSSDDTKIIPDVAEENRRKAAESLTNLTNHALYDVAAVIQDVFHRQQEESGKPEDHNRDGSRGIDHGAGEPERFNIPDDESGAGEMVDEGDPNRD